MTVYESTIEICLNPAFEAATRRSDLAEKELLPVCERYSVQLRGKPGDATTQEQSLLSLFWKRRAGHEYSLAKENGYVGSGHNCVFKLLYGVYGADIIAYLFDQPWVPATTINPFRAEPFLDRLSVLEAAAKRLKDGWSTPLSLRETLPCVKAGMGLRLRRFREKKHRLLLNYSLRELRDFGELGVSLAEAGKKPSVDISIYTGYDYDSEILRFASTEDEIPDQKE
jgi:hypothetical protein